MWTREELKQIDQRTRKQMTMHKALHPRDDVDRLYVSRKEIEDYIEKHEGGLLTAIRNYIDNTMANWMTITRKQKWEEKQLYERFKWLINNISLEKTLTWIRKGNFKKETESLPIAAQNYAIRIKHIKARIDKTQQNSKCKLCGDRDEIINLIISEYSKLEPKEYKTRHDWVVKVTHCEMCKKENFDHMNKWYNPASVLENDTHKLHWNFDIQKDHLISARRKDFIIIINKKKEKLQNYGLYWPDWRQNKTEIKWKEG